MAAPCPSAPARGREARPLRHGLLLAAFVASALYARQRAFVPAPADRAAQAPAIPKADSELSGRRSVLSGMAWALAGGAVADLPDWVAGDRRAAWALKDARTDSICTFKCINICQEKLDVNIGKNKQYCDDTCTTYCAESNQEKALNEQVGQNSLQGKILKNARKGKFTGSRQDEKKVGQIDKFFGDGIVPTEDTDYKNGMRERVIR